MASKSLLTIPSETRSKILQHLLQSETPLRRGSLELLNVKPLEVVDFSFDPVILRVCRQLHREGLSILYDNTFVLEARTASKHFHSGMFLDRAFDLRDSKSRIPQYLRIQSRKTEITIIVQDGIQEIYELIAGTVLTMSQNPQWSSLMIKFADFTDLTVESKAMVEAACHLFTYLRALRRITFNDISIERGAEFAQKMTSASSVTNLVLEYDALHQVIDNWYYECSRARQSRGPVPTLLQEIRRARNSGDVTAFIDVREQIVTFINSICLGCSSGKE